MQDDMNPAFHRLQLITGKQGIELLAKTRVILFGIGGVGSWAAEALARSGIGTLTIVDSDVVCITNVNRQVQATTRTVGMPKTDEMLRRLREINPDAEIIAHQTIFSKENADQFKLGSYDYVLDAIDSLSNKVELIMRASASGAKVYTALGASCKLDATRIKVSSLWHSHGCPLGKLVRKRLRQNGFDGDVTCVYSTEILPLQEAGSVCGTGNCHCPRFIKGENGEMVEAHEWCSSKKQINGSAAHITGTFGFMLAGLVMQDVYSKLTFDPKPAVSEEPAETAD
jgi:tRNA A37 threonylcarbamoyladenosine dehydratase